MSRDGLPFKSEVDAVCKAIETFAVAERKRNFHFLARNSHHRVNEKDLSVFRVKDESINTSTKVSNVDPGLLFGSVWYMFDQKRWGITDTVPLRYWLNASVIDEKNPAGMSDTEPAFPIDQKNRECDVQSNTGDTGASPYNGRGTCQQKQSASM